MLEAALRFIVIVSCFYLQVNSQDVQRRRDKGSRKASIPLNTIGGIYDDEVLSISDTDHNGIELSRHIEEVRELEITLKRYFSNEVEVDPSRNEILKDFGTSKRNINDETETEEQRDYINEWVVHMKGGLELANKVIDDLGYQFHGRVKGFKDVYQVAHKYGDHIRKKRETTEITEHIQTHDEVVWAEQQFLLRRDKRPSLRSEEERHEDMLVEAHNMDISRTRIAHRFEALFNDALWPKQWYLFDTRTRDDLPELDLEVIEVWQSGITGSGVKVSVIDDGLEWTHPDIADNYEPTISYDVNDDDYDPMPAYDNRDSNSHGTSCAGEIAMKPDNGLCGVGIAHGARIGGVRLLDGFITDKIESQAFQIVGPGVDIFSCSWGPTDNGVTVEGPGRLAKMAIEEGIREGRGGKGVIYIWAGGNGGADDDNCNCDGYTSSIYTISIGSAAESGRSPFYAELCSSTLATTYSSGAYTDQKISTIALRGGCTSSFTGTSAAAPLAAGVVALALEVNPDMTWRDMQHAIIHTSSWEKLKNNPGWRQNAKKIHFNMSFGFGLINAAKLVNASKTWTRVPEQITSEIPADLDADSNGNLFGVESPLTTQIEYGGGSSNGDPGIVSLEHVQVITTLAHPCRGRLSISLTSPQGTESMLLTVRTKDCSPQGFNKWPFMSLKSWGEDPRGTWTLKIIDTSSENRSGQLKEAILVLYGTQEVPEHLKNI